MKEVIRTKFKEQLNIDRLTLNIVKFPKDTSTYSYLRAVESKDYISLTPFPKFNNSFLDKWIVECRADDDRILKIGDF